MDTMMLHAHKGFAYLLLLFSALFSVALLMAMFTQSGKISSFLKKITTFTMIFYHVQALVGLVLLFVFSAGMKEALSAGTLMKDGARQLYVEHPVSMIIAAVLLTIVNKKLKTEDRLSVKIVVMGIIAVALFVSAFPWDRTFGA